MLFFSNFHEGYHYLNKFVCVFVYVCILYAYIYLCIDVLDAFFKTLAWPGPRIGWLAPSFLHENFFSPPTRGFQSAVSSPNIVWDCRIILDSYLEHWSIFPDSMMACYHSPYLHPHLIKFSRTVLQESHGQSRPE